MGEDLIFANSIVVADDLLAREACPVAALSTASGSSCPLGDFVVFDSVGRGDGGSVSEEVRVTSVARETLRSQPTDGLRQSPSPPAVPESGVEGGVGMGGLVLGLVLLRCV
ncbi:hypothetical protein Dimus_015935 [Dionaea muscipula]